MQSTIHKEKSNFFNMFKKVIGVLNGIKKVIGFFTIPGILSLIVFLDQKNLYY